MTISLIPPTYPNLKYIADNLTPADRDEIAATSPGRKPVKVLQRSVRDSYECFVVAWNDEPQLVFGITTTDAGVGIPWMLSTGGMVRWPKAFMKGAHRIVQRWLKMHGVLFNCVHARHAVAIRWLRALGFDVQEHEVVGVNEEPFFRFEMKADQCVNR
jgi:hypothetical protein